ncbi:amino acid ABC transporter membrane protein 1, PAAT family [Psychromonas ingrahamii 37]|uniref:Amino acid ABC transporter membrane protein 1, PAAT family n=1 Tax=Psychromonas ingrahamii (strain DSM 17664 / CCUG 51855 / 37) TaxID=357804 RepID=A1SYH3_PSYIN|nr:ABC transporter permease [Psychromonas ingrahamii]ABM04538.1 amino acid ABC transporter membrane protein 1, PAAT family [Psychromonas ingrahamii 37]
MLELQNYSGILLEGAWLTIQVALLSLLLAVFLGLLGASAKLSHSVFLKGIGTLYTTLIRGIPDLILMLLIFFGGQVLVNNLSYSLNEWINRTLTGFNPNHEWAAYLPDYINISPYIAGIITIGFIFGAYMAETFRGAFLAVEKGQLEAATAYGMNKYKLFLRVMFPQMMRHALPGIGNNWLVLLKTTALVSVIGLQDMVKIAGDAGGSTQQPFTFYIAIALVFLFFTSVSSLLFSWAERKYTIKTR